MQRPTKYHSRKTVLDGITFDSIREAERYAELKILEKAGVIQNLELQKRFELQPAFINAEGTRRKPIFYVCDFFYREGDKQIIEDVKSPVTANNAVYKLKKKMMEYKGYTIREVM